MTAADAQERYPGARPDPTTGQVREIPDTDAELAHAMVYYQSAGRDSVQPPQERVMERPSDRPSNVAGMLLAGRYRYVDFPGAPPVEVDVTWELGECIVRFPPTADDEGAELLASDVAGEFIRV